MRRSLGRNLGNPKITLTVTINVTPLRAVRLIGALKRLAVKSSLKQEQDFWARQARALEVQCEGYVFVKRNFVKRPPHDDEIAVERVIGGGDGPEMPVLSWMDCRRVVARIGHMHSSRELATLLNMSRRTITRWRAEHQRGEWKKYGIE